MKNAMKNEESFFLQKKTLKNVFSYKKPFILRGKTLLSLPHLRTGLGTLNDL